MNQQQLKFQNALDAFRNGDLETSRALCLKILKKNKRDENTAHLLALIYKQENNFVSAKKYFEFSLRINPAQEAVWSNFANLLSRQNINAEAYAAYKKSTVLNSKIVDAWYNWAILLNSMERYDEAREKILNAIDLNPDDARFYNVLGTALRGCEDYPGSIEAIEKAILLSKLDPGLEILASQNMAITYREMQKPEIASQLLAELIEKKISTPEIHFIKACADYDAGEYLKAEKELKHTIAMNPGYVEAHEALNKLYWEQSREEEFLDSYKNNIENVQFSRDLRYSHSAQLIMAGRNDEAKQVVTDAISAVGEDAGLLHSLGILFMRTGQSDDGLKYLDKAIKLEPDVARFRIDKANFLIKATDYKAALSHLDRAGKTAPLNQEVWAYKGLCWRLMGDDRAEWLNDYNALVDARFIEQPDDYDSLEHFLLELKNALQLLHKTIRQPLDQSVQNGTQTVGKLLSNPIKVIQDYRAVLTKSVEEYLQALPENSKHPFLNRNTKKFRHTGSWSVKLKSGGFHSNHMHPQGWLSNCTYISIPENIKPDDPEKAGWIKFGETSLGLGELEKISKSICPEEGLRVLFPSYFWHGTVPFRSDDFRITLPSDISPVV